MKKFLLGVLLLIPILIISFVILLNLSSSYGTWNPTGEIRLLNYSGEILFLKNYSFVEGDNSVEMQINRDIVEAESSQPDIKISEKFLVINLGEWAEKKNFQLKFSNQSGEELSSQIEINPEKSGFDNYTIHINKDKKLEIVNHSTHKSFEMFVILGGKK